MRCSGGMPGNRFVQIVIDTILYDTLNHRIQVIRKASVHLQAYRRARFQAPGVEYALFCQIIDIAEIFRTRMDRADVTKTAEMHAIVRCCNSRSASNYCRCNQCVFERGWQHSPESYLRHI